MHQKFGSSGKSSRSLSARMENKADKVVVVGGHADADVVAVTIEIITPTTKTTTTKTMIDKRSTRALVSDSVRASSGVEWLLVFGQ